MESYEKIKKVLALGFMKFLDENKPKDKMCLSNGECADIEKAFNEKDWPKLDRYLDKYAESEDERARKRAIAILKQQRDYWSYDGPMDKFPPATPRKDLVDAIDVALSYIEKQKDAFENGRQLGIMQEQARQELEWTDEKQKEQNPAEWSDADMKEARNNLISVCRDWERGEQTTLLPIVAVRARYFLEHLTEPKPVEWSEEDEKKIHFLSRLIEFQVKDGEYCFGEGACAISKQEAIEMLQSLRPSWKPSEELLDALHIVAYLPELEFYGGLKDKIRELYKQLKKL